MNKVKRQLTVPEKHQLRIARKTLTYHPAAIAFLPGPTLEEAKATIKRLTS